MDKWTLVEDALPPDGENVLCWYEYFRFGSYNRLYRTFGIGYQYNGNWGGEVSNGRLTRVLAWRPLPDPPKELERYGLKESEEVKDNDT